MEAISAWLIDYEDKQEYLISLLQQVGIDKGLNDKDEDGNIIPLVEIDPFTFYALILKKSRLDSRQKVFLKLKENTNLEFDVPQDFYGVPNPQPMNAWLFPYKEVREDDSIPALWKVFKQSRTESIEAESFNKALAIRYCAMAKLTEGLFYTAPEKYFPVDGQTRPWLKRNNIAVPKDFSAYQQCLDSVKEEHTSSFYEISYMAWAVNQGGSDEKPKAVGAVSEPEGNYEVGRKLNIPLNNILYGPPGIGKTYITAEKAVEITDPDWYAQALNGAADEFHEACASRYAELVDEKRIVFTTFHQSFAYEDFIEGIRAVTDEETKALSYPIVDGVFKRLVKDARKSTGTRENLGIKESPSIWKVSIGRNNEAYIRDYCFEHGQARIGWNDTGDLTVDDDEATKSQRKYWNELSSPNQNTLSSFSQDIDIGDVIVCLKDQSTARAIGVVTSDYYFEEVEFDDGSHMYAHVRGVNWLFTGIDLNILALNGHKKMVQKTVYPLDRIAWDDLVACLAENGHSLKVEAKKKPNYVMVIDEINRGNISRIFGELITLLEDSKREGAEDAREVVLPYSKDKFIIPQNVYLIGTMNTADKSLTQLDLALRRRFNFEAMLPDSELLDELFVHDISIQALLKVINERIEVLLDQDHLIGHTYFFSLKTASDLEEELANIFKNKIIPLLKEYFFDDWERIGWVLNDPAKKSIHRFIAKGGSSDVKELFSAKIVEKISDRRYQVNNDAFEMAEAYQGIIAVDTEKTQ